MIWFGTIRKSNSEKFNTESVITMILEEAMCKLKWNFLMFSIKLIQKEIIKLKIVSLSYFVNFYFFFGQVAWWLELTQLNCGEVECPGFEPRPLHIICNIPTNWAKLTGMLVLNLNYMKLFYKDTEWALNANVI